MCHDGYNEWEWNIPKKKTEFLVCLNCVCVCMCAQGASECYVSLMMICVTLEKRWHIYNFLCSKQLK